ncbi:MAG: CheY-like chemotaxis protein [Urechidicola sp.]|jgi:CheY-like chemotaxis protein
MNNTSLGTALIVDDDRSNRFILKTLLKQYDYRIVEANNGQEAIDQYHKEKPDIIFMDVIMPIMDGYVATTQIKAAAGSNFVPVIFLTAMSDEKSITKCIEVGGDDFMVKPYDPFLLKTKIQAMHRIATLNRKVQGMYSMINREQELAEAFFINAIQGQNVKSDFLKTSIRPADTFSGDMVLSAYSPSQDLFVMIGDFTGHGLSAALGAMPVSELFRAMTKKGYGADYILSALNDKLHKLLPTGIFFGIQLIVVSHNLELATIYNAGMPEVLIVDGKTNKIKHSLKSRGLPLGVIADIDPKEIGEQVSISRNDKILMFSDGLTEALNPDDEAFGEDRLAYGIAEATENNLFEHIFCLLDAFCGDMAQADDVTLVEVSCVPGILPIIDASEPKRLSKAKGEWDLSFKFLGERLLETNPVPIIVGHIMELEGVQSERQSIYTVLTELYLNALDHGVLGLSSSLKSDPNGFAQYFADRESKLSSLKTGFIQFNLNCRQGHGFRDITVRIEDSGDGFDYKNYKIPESNEIALSGRGLVLVNEFCESLTYEGNGNIASAVFRSKTA